MVRPAVRRRGGRLAVRRRLARGDLGHARRPRRAGASPGAFPGTGTSGPATAGARAPATAAWSQWWQHYARGWGVFGSAVTAVTVAGRDGDPHRETVGRSSDHRHGRADRAADRVGARRLRPARRHPHREGHREPVAGAGPPAAQQPARAQPIRWTPDLVPQSITEPAVIGMDEQGRWKRVRLLVNWFIIGANEDGQEQSDVADARRDHQLPRCGAAVADRHEGRPGRTAVDAGTGLGCHDHPRGAAPAAHRRRRDRGPRDARLRRRRAGRAVAGMPRDLHLHRRGQRRDQHRQRRRRVREARRHDRVAGQRRRRVPGGEHAARRAGGVRPDRADPREPAVPAVLPRRRRPGTASSHCRDWPELDASRLDEAGSFLPGSAGTSRRSRSGHPSWITTWSATSRRRTTR